MHSRIILSVFFFFNSISAVVAQNSVDSLKSVLKTSKDPVQRCVILSKLSDTAPEGEWQGYTEQLGRESKYYMSDRRYSNDPRLIRARANYFNNKSYLLKDENNYSAAICLLDSAFELLKIVNDTYELSLNQINVGACFDRIGESQKALSFYNSALNKLNKYPPDEYHITLNNNIGNNLLLRGDTDKAKPYFNAAYIVGIENDILNLAMVKVSWHLGLILATQRQVDSSFFYFKEALRIAHLIEDPLGISLSQSGIAKAYLTNGNIVLARKYSDSAFALIQDTRSFFEAQTVALVHHDVCVTDLDYQHALEAFRFASIARDSINKQENLKSMLSYQLKTELREKERIRQETLRREQAEKEARKRTQYLGIFSFVIFLLTAFAVLKRSALPLKLVDNIGFVGVLLFFQFIDLVINPFVDEWSLGSPVVFMGINIALASLIKPLHDYIERKVFQGKRRTDNPTPA